jgi:hypothetical protein
MLIEFRIQLDGNGGATVVQAQASPNPNSPSQIQLPQAYVSPVQTAQNPAPAQNPALAQNPKPRPGGAAPLDDPGTGLPTGTRLSSGSGPVFIIGPIVIFGSGPDQSDPGGAAPLDDPGTAKIKK